MRAGRQTGFTILQLLFVIALLFGLVTFVAPRWFPALSIGNGQGVGAQAYFNRVLNGIENSRRDELDRALPMAQKCATLTPFQADADKVSSCQYQPSMSQDYYILTVVSKTGEVFRYAGRGRE